MKIVIIGFGKIGKKHYEVFDALGCEVVGVSNRSKLSNENAKKLGVKKTYEDYHKMIKECKPDGILVCVPFWNNYQVVIELIPYKIPILLEKPSGISLKEHFSLIDLMQKFNTPILLGVNRRHYSVLNKALRDSGGRKNITSIQIEWSEDPIYLLQKKGYTNEQVSDMIFGNSVHGLDIITHLVGDLDKLNVSVKNYGKPFQRIMCFSGQTLNGCIVNFYSSWTNHIPWRVTFTTLSKRYVFAPLEKCLKTEVIKGVKTTTEIVPDIFDVQFKAGMYSQAKMFMNIMKTREIPKDYSLSSITPTMELANELTNAFK